jgi:hypothetical protein
VRPAPASFAPAAQVRPDARLLVVELILEPDSAIGAPLDYLNDVHMMAMFCSARERTRDEFAELFREAGLTLVRVVPTTSSASIIEAPIDLRPGESAMG